MSKKSQLATKGRKGRRPNPLKAKPRCDPEIDAIITESLVRAGCRLIDAYAPTIRAEQILDEAIARAKEATPAPESHQVDPDRVVNLKRGPDGVYD